MQNKPSQPTHNFQFPDLPDFDQTYVDRNTVKAHMLRAQAFSDLISEITVTFGNIFSGIFGWFSARAKSKSLRNELYSFSDRELSDIGLSRSDIKDVVAGSYVSRQTDLDTTNVKVLKTPKTADDNKGQIDTAKAA